MSIMVIYHEKIINSIIMLLLILPMVAMAATGNASSAKDLIGNPFTTFNSLPDSTRNGIMLVLGLVFLGALIAVVIGIMTAIGKASLGTTSQDAKMKSEGVTGLISIAGIVLLAMIVLGFVFWYFNTGNI
jgi:hypothetical protein